MGESCARDTILIESRQLIVAPRVMVLGSRSPYDSEVS